MGWVESSDSFSMVVTLQYIYLCVSGCTSSLSYNVLKVMFGVFFGTEVSCKVFLITRLSMFVMALFTMS